MLKNIISLLLFINLTFCQFGIVEISYEHNERSIPDDKIYILEEFNSLVKKYYESSQFSPENNFLDIPLKIHFIYEKINFISEYEYNSLSFQMLISNNADQYYYSKNINLPYSKGKSIYFSPSIFNTLNSFFDYYAYLFIGLELDTYDLFSGGTYYQKCLNLYSLKSESNYSVWEIFKDNIEIIKNNEHLRKARYNFYYCIDILNSDNIDLKLIKENSLLLIDNLKSIHDEFGYDKNTLRFIDSFHIEIADLFKLTDMNDGIQFLINFDIENKDTYKKYLNEKK